jgi:hypothetical protein
MSKTIAMRNPSGTSRLPRIAWTRIQTRVPKTICRVYDHPLLGFGRDSLDSDIHNSSDLILEETPLIDLGSIEMKSVRVNSPHHVVAKFNEVCALRSCSQEVLINSALAEWFDGSWYKGGHPKPFLEICKKIGIDLLMTSNSPETLQNYYAGVFGSPGDVGDTSFFSDPPFAWAEKLRKRYQHL